MAILTKQDDLIELAQRNCFANPFHAERQADERALFGVAIVEDEAAFARAYRQRMRGVERTLPLALFDAYLDLAPGLDAAIDRQLASGLNANVRLDQEVDALLQRAAALALPAPVALRVLAVFHQYRRLWRFIRVEQHGDGPTARGLRERIWDAVVTRDGDRYVRSLAGRLEDFPTLILGQTGTGKGAIARIIGHATFIPIDPATKTLARNFRSTFLTANLSEYPQALLESALFGHVKGAFTGAVGERAGILQGAKAGDVLFLDEIGDLDLTVQVKLLNVLQERRFSPVGSDESRRFNGRVIAATSRDLGALRAAGAFRDDFYYRITANVIEVPGLAQRLARDPGELASLVAHLTAKLVASDAAAITAEVLQAIERDLPPGYPWPGNVRELEQCIRRVIMTGRCAEDGPRPEGDLIARIQARGYTAKDLLAAYCRAEFDLHKNYSTVARNLGLDRRTVQKYVEA